jgi:hypothetical protein
MQKTVSFANKHLMEDEKHIYDYYALLQENEHHFNRLQAGYRKMASGWLLAVFAGVGFVLSDLPDHMESFTFLFIALIFLAGAIGIFLLSIIDLKVYHPLLEANTEVGERLEEKYIFLPKIHQTMQIKKKGSVRGKTILFYRVPVVLLSLLSGLCMVLFFFIAI